MRRRDFIAGIAGSAAAWPLAARAQQSATVSRIGFLMFDPGSAYADRGEALRAGLRQLGYVEGKNITIEFRLAKTVNQLPELAAELVRMNVDVIFALSSTEVEAARQATNTIPIVFGLDADPISLGHVASLARPGGNITGLTVIQTDLVAKQLEMLKEAVPQAMRIGVLFSPTAPSHRPAVQAVETAGERLGIQLIMLPAWTIEDFEGVFSTMSREHAGGFLAVGAPLFGSHRARLAELALAHRLAGTFANKEHVEAGGFISYGPDFNDMVWRAAAYVDKILKGAKPADLPVDQASKYELVINLKTAKAIGLNLSEAFLLRADKVIE